MILAEGQGADGLGLWLPLFGAGSVMSHFSRSLVGHSVKPLGNLGGTPKSFTGETRDPLAFDRAVYRQPGSSNLTFTREEPG